MVVCICAGLTFGAIVSLRSIEIFKTHEWLKATTTVYFLCKGENETVLPDVKKPHAIYAFNGQESWQVSYTLFCSPFWLSINCFYFHVLILLFIIFICFISIMNLLEVNQVMHISTLLNLANSYYLCLSEFLQN